MRFFSTNYLYKNFGGTYAASSNTAFSSFSFDELSKYSWYSSGEGTDGDAIYLERVLGFAESIDRIFVRETNISNLFKFQANIQLD